MKTGQKTYNLTELCELLSISQATAKNWLKLGKLTPDITNDKPNFSKKYVENLIKKINSKSSNLLKSRRNKKFLSGSFFYKDYVSDNSKNFKNVQNLLEYLKLNKITLTEEEIKYILADCTIQLICGKNLSEYLTKKISLNNFSKLVEDLITDKKSAEKFVKNNPELFNYTYIFEENEDILGLLYLSLSNLNGRKSRGAYFTPTKVVEKVVKHLNFNKSTIKNDKILDSCCGSGNFLLQLPKFIDLEQIFGYDIDKTSITLTRINMALKYEPKNIDVLYKNFEVKNFLSDNDQTKFQYIIGNPPWGYEFSAKETKLLKEKYISAKSGNIESYDVFVEKSLSTLNKNGELFFVLPEAILNVKKHKNIRKIILENTSILYLEYLENIFDKVQCPCIIINLKNTKQKLSCINTKIKTKEKEFVIKKEREINLTSFNFALDDTEYAILTKIISSKNIVYLKNNAVFGLGIVTGDNKNYLSKTKTKDNEPIIKGSDIEKYKINQAKQFIQFYKSKFQQVAPIEIYRKKEKLFYKFISDKLIFAYDNKQTLSLNSCNILIPTFEDLDIKYIMAVLNSTVAQFIFKKQFNSIKVLRSHIENIPIPVCDKKTQDKIIALVDKILNSDKNSEKIHEEIDLIITKLYGLTKKEYELIK